MNNSHHLQAGGTLDLDSVYVERSEDRRLFELLSRGEYVNLLASRQMGKSSLILRTLAKLEADGVRTSFVDLSTLGTPDNTEEYFLGLLDEIADQMIIDVNVESWWHSSRAVTASQKLRRFFVEVLAEKDENPVVVALDEIDSTLRLKYTDDLFTCLRGMFNERHRVNQLERITFCLIGVATPNELIKNRRTTPYNIGETLTLRDFNPFRDDLSGLEAKLDCDDATAHNVLERIMYWTGGQPYLTVRACADFAANQITSVEKIDGYFKTNYSGFRQLSQDAHIEAILRFVDQRFTDTVACLGLYQRILLGEPVKDAKTPTHSELKLSGLVRGDDKGRLRVANRIYRKLFDEAWVESLVAGPEYVGAKREADYDLPGALAAYKERLEILKRLAASDPNDADRQHEVLVLQNKIGDLLVEMGDLTGGLDRYRYSLAIAEHFATADPVHAGWQRDLSAAHAKIGDVQMAQGDLGAALDSYRASLTIQKRLAANDPENAVWQRDLSVSHNKIGDAQAGQGDLAAAYESYRSGLAIAERLAATDPEHAAGWQRDLSAAHAKIGDVQMAQGNLALALGGYQASLAIQERLVAIDPENAGWQRDLSVTHDRIGKVSAAAGDLAAALESYRSSLVISKRLASADPENAAWQRDLSVSHVKIGDAQAGQGDLAAAYESYRSGLAIAERLAAIDPANAEWQRNISVLHDRIGNVMRNIGDLAAALESYRSSLTIAEHLARAYPKNTLWQGDLSDLHTKIGDVLRATGDLRAASGSYRLALAIVEGASSVNPGVVRWQRDRENLHSRLANTERAYNDLARAPEAGPIFLSYSQNDRDAALNLRLQLERHGLSVFQDQESIRTGDLWLARMQQALDKCRTFVVLVGHDGVKRWMGAETQMALSRYFSTQDDSMRLPIFPILLRDTVPEALPAFLRLFQATQWNGTDSLPEHLLVKIRERAIVANDALTFEGCPFVGLGAYRIDQAHLFFGRQKETLDALSCFDQRPAYPPVRWLQITGNSGVGKSSLMNAGLLPLVDQGWLWPRTGYAHWRRIGPMMPGEYPAKMLAEQLAKAFGRDSRKMRSLLENDDRGLADCLRSQEQDDTAFLLAIDQFEELFIYANPEQRRSFDRILAGALEDPACPFFAISTMRSDMIDRFEELPRLVAALNRLGRLWTLPPISADGLREVIDGPARLSGLDVSEVREAIVAEARDEPGALPLVSYALQWLWEQRIGYRLAGRPFTEQGGLAGILARGADDLLASLEPRQRDRALELLFRLVKVDPEGRRHFRQRITLAEAVDIAGGGDHGRDLVTRLAGLRALGSTMSHSPVRLIIITEDFASGAAARQGGWVILIHETLIRSKGVNAQGRPQPYWPTLWEYIQQHKSRAAWLEQLQADMRIWLERHKSPSYQWSHERVQEAVRALTQVGAALVLSTEELEFLGPIDPDAMVAELERPETSHKRRALIGERLDTFGDPRLGVGINANGCPEISWCLISSGESTIAIKSDPNNPHSEVIETLERTVQAFRVARYPVTVTQYHAFLQADDGWCDPVWWADDLYRDPEGESYVYGRFGNYPAVYVSWFDAMAYCRWLSKRLGFTVRLPGEWEWQRAATDGEEARNYPWGTDWEIKTLPHRANTFESRLGGITAVGMYPSGASSAGTLDMAGTVWEWCLNKFEKPEVTISLADDLDLRVLRGGSWGTDRLSARCANRLRADPNYRFVDIGFRVISLAPTSSN